MSIPETRAGRNKKSSKTPWIITIIILAVLVIAGVIALVLSQQGNTPGPNPTNSTVSPTASPTKTGTKSATPTASPTKTPTATPSPTKSPVPSPTANPAVAWADKVYGSFPTVAMNGGPTDGTFVALPVDGKGGIVTVSNNAADESPFTVYVMDQNNQVISQLVDVTGDYVGTVAYGLQQTGLLGSNPKNLYVISGGNWSVEIAKVGAAPATIPVTSTGDKVYLYNATGKVLHGSYPLLSGEFIVTQYSGSQPQANEIINNAGAIYDGDVTLPNGPGVLQVNATGGWALAIK